MLDFSPEHDRLIPPLMMNIVVAFILSVQEGPTFFVRVLIESGLRNALYICMYC